jgi:hypothetical protein
MRDLNRILDLMSAAVAIPLAHRQFYWGLSLGIIVLALAGFVWVAWALSAIESPVAAGLFGALDAVLTGSLIWAGIRVRRRAGGFRRTDLRKGDEQQRRNNRRMNARFRWIVLGEWTGIGLAAFATYHFGRGDLFPPAMSLVIALHFFALADLFHLRVYRATADVGSLFCTTLLLAPATLGSDARLILKRGWIRQRDVGESRVLRSAFREAGCGLPVSDWQPARWAGRASTVGDNST